MNNIENINTFGEGWEQQRRTGRFVAEPYTLEEANSWLSVMGLPQVKAGETFKQWSDRIAHDEEKDRGSE